MNYDWCDDELEPLDDPDLDYVQECARAHLAELAGRNDAIQQARRKGHSLRSIAEAAHLSVEAVRRIAARS